MGMMLPVVTARAQDTLMITKSEILTRINTDNLQVKIAENSFSSAQADYKQSTAVFLPSITASHTAMVTNNPLMAFGSKLNQARVTQADFNPDILNNPDDTENYATVVEVIQPLINLDGFQERKAAKSKMEAYELQTGRTREYLDLEVEKALMQLQLAYQALAVLEKAHHTANQNLKVVNDYFEQGMLQRADVLDVQIRVNEVQNQLHNAQSNVQNASDYIAFLMNAEDTDIVFKPSEAIVTDVGSTAFAPAVPDSRKDVMAMKKSVEAREKMYQSGKMKLMPRLNAFGSYQMYDDQLFGANGKGYLVGAQLTWTPFDGMKSIGKMEKHKVEYEKSKNELDQYLAQSQMELNRGLRQLKDAENKSRNSKLAHDQSIESYRIKQNRFTQGLIKTSDLLMAETQMYKKELEYLQTVFEYNYTKKYLEFLTQ